MTYDKIDFSTLEDENSDDDDIDDEKDEEIDVDDDADSDDSEIAELIKSKEVHSDKPRKKLKVCGKFF